MKNWKTREMKISGAISCRYQLSPRKGKVPPRHWGPPKKEQISSPQDLFRKIGGQPPPPGLLEGVHSMFDITIPLHFLFDHHITSLSLDITFFCSITPFHLISCLQYYHFASFFVQYHPLTSFLFDITPSPHLLLNSSIYHQEVSYFVICKLFTWCCHITWFLYEEVMVSAPLWCVFVCFHCTQHTCRYWMCSVCSWVLDQNWI